MNTITKNTYSLYPEIIRKSPEMIISFEEAKQKMLTKKGNINKIYTNIYQLLINLEKYLDKKYSNKVDPVAYIYYLYYTLDYDCYKIHELIGHLGGYKESNKGAIRSIIKTFLNFEAKEKKLVKQEVNITQSETNKLTKKFSEQVIEITLPDLKEKKSISEIITYIFFTFGIIKNDSESSLATLINFYHSDKNFSLYDIAKIFKATITKIKPKLSEYINIKELYQVVLQCYNRFYNNHNINNTDKEEKLIIEIKSKLKIINNFEEFKKQYQNTGFNKWINSLGRIEYKLIRENFFIKDPIVYICYLYLEIGEGLSCKQIHKKIKHFLHIKKEDSLTTLFNVIGLKKRQSKDIVLQNTREILSEKTKKRGMINKEIIKQKNEENVDKLLDILEGKRITNGKLFDLNEYNNQNSLVEKIRFILDYLGYISKENFYNEIEKLGAQHSNIILEIAINKILSNLPKEINFLPNLKINKGRISQIRNKTIKFYE